MFEPNNVEKLIESNTTLKLDSDLSRILLDSVLGETFAKAIPGVWTDLFKVRDESKKEPYIKLTDSDIELLKVKYKIQIGVSVNSTPILYHVKDDHNIVQLTQPKFLSGLMRLHVMRPELKDKNDITRYLTAALFQQPLDLLTFVGFLDSLNLKLEKPLKDGDSTKFHFNGEEVELSHSLDKTCLMSRVMLKDLDGLVIAAWVFPMTVPTIVAPNVFSL